MCSPLLRPPSEALSLRLGEAADPGLAAALAPLTAAARARRRRAPLDPSPRIDPRNPAGAPPDIAPIFGSSVWRGLDARQHAKLLLHTQAWQIAQNRALERGFLAAALRLSDTLPDPALRAFAAEAAADAALHAELCDGLLDLYPFAYRPTGALSRLLSDAASAERTGAALLLHASLLTAMALANLTNLRDLSADGPVRRTLAFVMEGQSRFAAFARIALQATAEREALDAPTCERLGREAVRLLRAMRDDMLLDPDVFEPMGVGRSEAEAIFNASPMVGMYRALLFQRAAPFLRAAGLVTDEVRAYLRAVGAEPYLETDFDLFSRSDRRIAEGGEA